MSLASNRALARLAASDWRGALAELAAPEDAEDSAVLGMVHLAAEDWQAAYSALRRAITLGDDTPATQINLALAEDRLGLAGRARLRVLARHLPDWDEPLVRLADSYRRAGEVDDAIAQYEVALERNPDRAGALLSLGVLLLGRGAVERAQALLTQCCRLAPGLAEAWDALGIALMLIDDAAGATAAFAQAQALRPDSIEIAQRRTEAAVAASGAAAELARLATATAADPLDVPQLLAQGLLLERLGHLAEAGDLLETVVALAPEAPEALSALAHVRIRTARFDLAVPLLRRAVALAPHDFRLRHNLAAALNRVHRYREGRELLEALIAEADADPAPVCNLATALFSLGLQEEAVEVARRATRLAPDDPTCWRTLASAIGYCDGAAGGESFATWQRVGAMAWRGTAAPPPPPRDVARRLRLGLLSNGLRTHPVGWLTAAAFEALDPAAFELVGFGQPPSQDLMQRRFRASAAGWHAITGRSAAEIAELVRQAEIDILIDLGGWGEDNTLSVCAQRPAPVQIKWVGSQSHTTGLAEIDWFVTDRWETPPGSEAFYVEKLLQMPDGYVCYSPPATAPEVADLPAAASGRVTFGCFNNLAKITHRTIAVWSAILARVEGARLVLKTHQYSDPETADMVHARFARHGIDPARVELRGSSSHRTQLAQHNDVDIVLDPFPYSGGLTTCEALWMGVPVVTVPAESFASRHSASHLNNIGLAEWVAPDLDAYQEIAVARAADLAGLRRLRAELRPRMQASPLCDVGRFAGNLAAALRQIWRAACAAAA